MCSAFAITSQDAPWNSIPGTIGPVGVIWLTVLEFFSGIIKCIAISLAMELSSGVRQLCAATMVMLIPVANSASEETTTLNFGLQLQFQVVIFHVVVVVGVIRARGTSNGDHQTTVLQSCSLLSFCTVLRCRRVPLSAVLPGRTVRVSSETAGRVLLLEPVCTAICRRPTGADRCSLRKERGRG